MFSVLHWTHNISKGKKVSTGYKTERNESISCARELKIPDKQKNKQMIVH